MAGFIRGFFGALRHCTDALCRHLRKLGLLLRIEPRPHLCPVRGGEDWPQQSLHPFPVRLPLPKVTVREEEEKIIKSQGHRLNMELDLRSLFGLHVT
jgi:hypothetical protein